MKKKICSLVALLILLGMLPACSMGYIRENENDKVSSTEGIISTVDTTEATEASEETLPTDEPTEPPTEAPTQAPTEPVRTEMSAPDIAELAAKATVTVHTDIGTGSGFFIDDKGTLITCFHVIDGAEEISVEVSGGGSYDVKTIVNFSELYDIAILKASISDNAYLTICEDAVRQGEAAYALGSSLGYLDGTFSNGIVSHASRMIGMIDCVQTTAATYGGNSGGPLLNSYCEVIGINAYGESRGESLNYAISMDMLDKLGADKNWSLSQFREWHDVELSRSYWVYNYDEEYFESSYIHTYQFVTGQECYASDYDWSGLDGSSSTVVPGYHDDYGVYYYAYNVHEFDQYRNYLNSIGFEYYGKEEFSEGTSYYYVNYYTGHCIDMFIMVGESLVVLEPYC